MCLKLNKRKEALIFNNDSLSLFVNISNFRFLDFICPYTLPKYLNLDGILQAPTNESMSISVSNKLNDRLAQMAILYALR